MTTERDTLSDVSRVATALQRRFTRAEYARRAYWLFCRAVRLSRASARGRLSTRTAECAVAEFCDYATAAGSPRRLVMRQRPGRR